MLFCWTLGGWASVVRADDAPKQGATTTTAAETSSAEGTEQSGTEQAPAKPSGWMDQVDGLFGRFVVAPMAAVIFFDFGTSQWLGTSVPFVVLWLLGGAIYFTVRMNFINLRGFWHAIRLTAGHYDAPGDKGEVTHFQALASAISATVGLGNIAGVAIAIGTGGPGAAFWIMLAGILGMSSKFAECTLGQLYRKYHPDGTVTGGAMHYLKDGLAELGLAPLGKVLALMFTVMCIGGSFGGGNSFQVGQSLNAIRQEVPFFDNYPWVYGLLMAGLAGAVIIGGIRSIAKVADKIVPLMCGVYILAASWIVLAHAAQVPAMIRLIFAEAFQWKSAYGGMLGVMVIGLRRAVFSNEAGVGSAAIAHAAAKTNEPVSEGIVALLEPFIDTVVVCTMSALVMIASGVYDDPQYKEMVASNQGAALMTAAFRTSGHDLLRWVLYATVFLFAYSTLISWSYYGERCWTTLFGPRSSTAYKVVFLGFTVLGSIVTEGNILDFSDLLILGMAFPNILGVALLSGRVRRELDSYWRKYKSGELEPRRSEG